MCTYAVRVENEINSFIPSIKRRESLNKSARDHPHYLRTVNCVQFGGQTSVLSYFWMIMPFSPPGYAGSGGLLQIPRHQINMQITIVLQ